MNNLQNNNHATIYGKVVSELEFSHKSAGEKFYNIFISVERLSGVNDIIPVVVSERRGAENMRTVQIVQQKERKWE